MNPADAPEMAGVDVETYGSGATHLAGAVNQRSGEIARRWIAAMDGAPGPDPGPAQAALAAEAERLVSWVTGPEPWRIPEEVPSALRALSDRREGRARLRADPHRDFHLLSRVLEEVLVEESRRHGDRVDAADVAAVSGQLQRALLTAVGVAGDIAEDRRSSEGHDGMEAFASMVRHELRNPLGAAQAAAQLLREDGEQLGPERSERVLRSLERSVRQAVETLSSVTALTGEKEAADVERWEPLSTTLQGIASLADGYADGVVSVTVVDPLPDLLVDADRIEILVHNLVENAVKYRDPTRSDPWVRVEVARDEADAGWWIRVRDNGVGVTPEEQERIFRRFYRAGGKDVEGTGLGLSIAREAARQMGGTVEVASTPGEGSVFSARIPDARTRPAG